MGARILTSISRRISRSIRSVTAVLVLPVVIGLVFMLAYNHQYQSMIRRMNVAAALKPVVETNLARDLFSVAAGRVSYEESGISGEIDRVCAAMESLLAETDGSRRVHLTIARRTMDTLRGYADQVRDGMREHRPVSEIEAIVDEVWEVGALVDDKIDAFIAEEIAAAGSASDRIRTVTWIAAAAECLLLAYALLRTHRVTRRLSSDIRQALQSLEETVRRIAEGRFQERVGGAGVAELRDLADQINLMAARLEGLIAQIRQKQEHLAKAELRTLQAQINPHFLYNTLDTIVWQAESGNAEEIISLTRSLSDFFRISLSSGADWIPAEQEIRHAEAYLRIQKIRYRDILNYSVEAEGDLSGVWVPKLLLQPLAENALYHGIKARRGGGSIRIAVRRDGERVFFAVADTGRGMTEEQLEAVRASLREDPAVASAAPDAEHGGFGLRNVDLRIRLYYRQDEGLTLNSDSGGTTVSFDVPAWGKEEIEHDESISGGR